MITGTGRESNLSPLIQQVDDMRLAMESSRSVAIAALEAFRQPFDFALRSSPVAAAGRNHWWDLDDACVWLIERLESLECGFGDVVEKAADGFTDLAVQAARESAVSVAAAALSACQRGYWDLFYGDDLSPQFKAEVRLSAEACGWLKETLPRL